MRARVLIAASALPFALVTGCTSADEAPTAAWCAAMAPFVSVDESSTRTVEVVEVTDENRGEIEQESAELRSRIAVLVSSAPSAIREDVYAMLNGGTAVTVEQVSTAREEVTAYHLRRC